MPGGCHAQNFVHCSKPYGPPGNRRTPSRRHLPGAARRFLSPHPDPLPRGEGTVSIAQRKADGCGLFSEQCRVHPLPRGEGRGGGKRREVKSRVSDQSRTCRTPRVLRQIRPFAKMTINASRRAFPLFTINRV